MHALVTGVSAGAGLLLGGELEIVVERLGERRPFDRPWWRCPSCATPYRGRGLVPVANALFLRRGCRSCRERVSHPWRPAVLGVVTAVVLGAFAARIGDDVVLAAYAVFGLSMVAMSAVDLERQIIPNRLVYPTLVVMVPLFVLASAVDDRWGSLARAAIAGAAAFLGLPRRPPRRARGGWGSATCAWPAWSASPRDGWGSATPSWGSSPPSSSARWSGSWPWWCRGGAQDQDPLRPVSRRRGGGGGAVGQSRSALFHTRVFDHRRVEAGPGRRSRLARCSGSSPRESPTARPSW